MKYSAPLYDYIVQSTFPLASHITALVPALEASSIDFVHESTFVDYEIIPPHGGQVDAGDLYGLYVNGGGDLVNYYFKIRPSYWSLDSIYIWCDNITDPCNVNLYIRAGGENEACNTHSYGGTVVSFNSPYGTDKWWKYDLLAVLPAITNDDIVWVECLYTATAPVTDIKFSCIEVGYSIA